MVSDGHIHVHPEKARISAVAFDRLPSEAEWEYACRAGTKTAFSFGATITTAQANFSSGGRKARRGTVAVGSLPVNGWGRHETHGNVWEWCEDGLGPYPDRPTRHPCRMGSARRRVCCAAVPGAAPHGTSAPPIALRSLPRSAAFTFGFRLARTPGGSPALRPAYSCLYPPGGASGRGLLHSGCRRRLFGRDQRSASLRHYHELRRGSPNSRSDSSSICPSNPTMPTCAKPTLRTHGSYVLVLNFAGWHRLAVRSGWNRSHGPQCCRAEAQARPWPQAWPSATRGAPSHLGPCR